MAICVRCGLEMLEAASCLPKRGAARYGSEAAVYSSGQPPPDPWPDRCRDCAVPDGGVHHDGCFVEQCEVCKDQWAFCRHGARDRRRR